MRSPDEGKYLGWVYTTANEWRRFGNVSLSADADQYLFDEVGIGTTSFGDSALRVVSGSSMFDVSDDGVGIGTTANVRDFALLVTLNSLEMSELVL